MLRRLSDVTLSSFDKIILKIGTKDNLKEKKRKLKSRKGEESESDEAEEKNEVRIIIIKFSSTLYVCIYDYVYT